MVIGTLVVSLGAVSNIYGMNNPEQIEEASQLSNAQKMSYYGTLIGITMVIPYIISMIAFKIYDVTEKNIIYKNGKKSIDSNNGGTIRN